jgi:outer membrane protein assembly factor BamB
MYQQEKWKNTLEDLNVPSMGSHSTPVIKDSLIYIHRPGEIACFSFVNGSPVWNFRLLTAGVTSPVISGENLVTACWYNFS